MQVVDWQRIADEYGSLVWQTAYKLLGNHADASDCFQETFICALEISQRQRVRDFSSLLRWLATARAIDRLRQRYSDSKIRTNAVDVATIPSAKPGPEHSSQTSDMCSQLRKALSRLPAKEAEVFCLRCFSEFSYSEIARELGIKTNTVGVLLHRARARLRELLEPPPEQKNKGVL